MHDILILSSKKDTNHISINFTKNNTMKKLLTFLFALTAALSINAEEYYLVGDGTKIGWTDNSTDRQANRMYEKESGVFEYIGLLKHASEGFNIVDTNNGWNGFSCSTENYAIGDAGTDNYKIRQEWDKKWNPEDENWRWYTITLNTNNGTLSWARDTFTPLTAVDGVYYIGTAEELYKLAIMVRSISEESYKVKLTADIDYTAYSNGINCAIGNVEKCAFNGEFDGQGHTITVDMKAYWTRFSLFGTIAGSVHDLKVAGKITATDKNQIGGICGLLSHKTVSHKLASGNGDEIFHAGAPGTESDVGVEACSHAETACPDGEGVGQEHRDVHTPEPHVGRVIGAAPDQEKLESGILAGRDIAAALQDDQGLHFDGQAPGDMVDDESAAFHAEARIGVKGGFGDIHRLAAVVGLQEHTHRDRAEFQGIGILRRQDGPCGEKQEEWYENTFHGNAFTGGCGRRP